MTILYVPQLPEFESRQNDCKTRKQAEENGLGIVDREEHTWEIPIPLKD